MKLSFYLPTKPSVILQVFGANPAYYSKFLDPNGNPIKGHMGIDFQAKHGTPIYAVCDGLAMYNCDTHGGDGIILNTGGGFDYEGGTNMFNLIFWHLCPWNDPDYPIEIPTDGNWHNVKAGQILGYADNTGAPYESTGDHLHFGLCPLNDKWLPIDPGNGYGGCIDPAPYFNGITIQDYSLSKTVSSAVQATEEVTQAVVQSDETPAQKMSFLAQLADLWDTILSIFKRS